jgi:hypothetical protein
MVPSNSSAMFAFSKARNCVIPHVDRETDPPEAASTTSLLY